MMEEKTAKLLVRLLSIALFVLAGGLLVTSFLMDSESGMLAIPLFLAMSPFALAGSLLFLFRGRMFSLIIAFVLGLPALLLLASSLISGFNEFTLFIAIPLSLLSISIILVLSNKDVKALFDTPAVASAPEAKP